MSTWIAITDRLPPEGEAVLVWTIDGCLIRTLYGGVWWPSEEDPTFAVSHWQALPPGPQATLRQDLGDRRDWDGLEALEGTYSDDIPNMVPDPLTHRPTWKANPTPPPAFLFRCLACGHAFNSEQRYGRVTCPQCGGTEIGEWTD